MEQDQSSSDNLCPEYFPSPIDLSQNKQYRDRQKTITHRIALISDFFFPRLGGVETHQYSLSQALMKRGHKVIVITHGYKPDRYGVRWMTNGLKVYYVPLVPFTDQDAFPTLFGFFPLLRDILIREEISIIHTHQATSVMGHQSTLHAKTMGIPTVYTHHSLFSFADMACININKVLKVYLTEVDACTCVSHICKQNLAVSARLPPHKIHVIPNGIDTTVFRPDTTKRNPQNSINIVFINRLTFRKGVDLLVELIPLCFHKAKKQRLNQLHFIIAGGGQMEHLVQEMVKREGLQDKVELLGPIPHHQVRNVLVRGQIFLMTSLTECGSIALLEACASGLLCVTTNVGGQREMLPPQNCIMAQPTPEALADAIEMAWTKQMHIEYQRTHQQINSAYNWHDLAARVENIYDQITIEHYGREAVYTSQKRRVNLLPRPKPLSKRIKRAIKIGPFVGMLFMFIIVIDYLFLKCLSYWKPAHSIERAPDFKREKYFANLAGDHEFSVKSKL